MVEYAPPSIAALICAVMMSPCELVALGSRIPGPAKLSTYRGGKTVSGYGLSSTPGIDGRISLAR
ncbi:MAG: hypothetical protein QF898_05470 [SAR202 cluster bacterium]|nr:hypothetical protein [SAR202 cluster bacterium]MDP6714683.1 hypothetical protein [SAR202 cluster bacterium]